MSMARGASSVLVVVGATVVEEEVVVAGGGVTGGAGGGATLLELGCRGVTGDPSLLSERNYKRFCKWSFKWCQKSGNGLKNFWKLCLNCKNLFYRVL